MEKPAAGASLVFFLVAAADRCGSVAVPAGLLSL
jgi:hypothetical protein